MSALRPACSFEDEMVVPHIGISILDLLMLGWSWLCNADTACAQQQLQALTCTPCHSNDKRALPTLRPHHLHICLALYVRLLLRLLLLRCLLLLLLGTAVAQG